MAATPDRVQPHAAGAHATCRWRALYRSTGPRVPETAWRVCPATILKGKPFADPSDGEPMPRFYFDVRDGDRSTHDDEGVELVGIEEARDEATRALGEIARDALRLSGSLRRELSIEVRDESPTPVLRASLWFEVEKLT